MFFNQRIEVTRDIHHANGDLRVAQGATGRVSSDDRGYLGIVFDEGQEAFVARDGSGRLIQSIPLLDTRVIDTEETT